MTNLSRLGVALLLAAVATIAGCSTSSQSVLNAQTEPPAPMLVVNHAGVAPNSPWYTVSIFDDGSVVYEGLARVRITGQQRVVLSREKVEVWRKALLDLRYLDWPWPDARSEPIPTDLDFIEVTFAQDGRSRMTRVYAWGQGAPAAFFNVLADVRVSVDAEGRWVR